MRRIVTRSYPRDTVIIPPNRPEQRRRWRRIRRQALETLALVAAFGALVLIVSTLAE